MKEREGVPYTITDPQVETLAIMLYSHESLRDGGDLRSWFDLDTERREMYRAFARGTAAIEF